MEKCADSVSNQKGQFLNTCPFTCIRKVLKAESGTGSPLKDILIGDIRLARSSFDEHPEESEGRTQAQKRNNELLAGDKTVIRSLAGATQFG